MLHVEIDELTPCLVDALTGEQVSTEVVQIVRKSFLDKFKKNNGWYTDWGNLLNKGCEVYALVLKGTLSIQGLIALHNDDNMQAIFIDWACASPHNNKMRTDNVLYKGIGGHLFAIAAQLSFERGYEGFISGFAANKKLMDHYCDKLGAQAICQLHEYQIAVFPHESAQIREVYDYEWTDDKL